MLDLNDFTDKSPSHVRYYVTKPFNVDEYTIACNGHIMLVTPKCGDYESLGEQQKWLIDLAKSVVSKTYTDTVPPVLPEKTKCTTCSGSGRAILLECPECDGEGEIELSTSYHDYAVECKTCRGTGETLQMGGDKKCPLCNGHGSEFKRLESVVWGDIKIQAKYAELFINEPDIQIFPETEKNMLFLKSGTQFGIISGMKK